MASDFHKCALAALALWAGKIAIEASLEGVACSVVCGLFFERWIGAQCDFGCKDLRCRPCPFDVCLFECDAAIGAVELVLVDESLAATTSNANTEACQVGIEGNDF